MVIVLLLVCHVCDGYVRWQTVYFMNIIISYPARVQRTRAIAPLIGGGYIHSYAVIACFVYCREAQLLLAATFLQSLSLKYHFLSQSHEGETLGMRLYHM